jgi:hypothetical protein
VTGSITAGEFPKFTALRELKESRTPHVIVKFAHRVQSERWSDLLIAEFHALRTVKVVTSITDCEATEARIIQNNNRTFLEVERFDRYGQFGRVPLVSLRSVSAHHVNVYLLQGQNDDWRSQAHAMYTLKILSKEDVERIKVLWWYGQLIANTDMHYGNISFFAVGSKLKLAPVYDMLPMAYAPLPSGEAPIPQTFAFKLPPPSDVPYWKRACEAAVHFWEQCADEKRISKAFRNVCEINCNQLKRIRGII